MVAIIQTNQLQVTRPRFVCTQCWYVFVDDGASTCPAPADEHCGAERPDDGWSHMPHRFRSKYMLMDLLGRGGMGAVFRAWNLDRGLYVALKVAPRLGGQDTQRQIRALFDHEMKQAAFLGTYREHFVSVMGLDSKAPEHDASDLDAYLEMEYVRLPTLHMLLRDETPMAPLRVARVGAALAASLTLMHRHGLVHRDLKPGNMFLFEQGHETKVKLFDLGLCIASHADPEKSAWRHLYPGRGMIPGTDDYMSPEQMDRRPLCVESDIHAVGSILWRLSSNSVPFPSVGKLQSARLEHRKKLVGTIPLRPPSMPEGLYAILKIALDPVPEKRFPKCVGDPKDYTPVMGLKRALEKFADDYVRERRKKTQYSRVKVQDLIDRTLEVRSKAENILQLADDAHRLWDELGRLSEELSDEEGESHTSITGVLDEMSRQVARLEHEIRLAVRHWEKRAKNRLSAWVPWTVAGLAAVMAAVMAMKGGGVAGSTAEAPAVAEVGSQEAVAVKSPKPISGSESLGGDVASGAVDIDTTGSSASAVADTSVGRGTEIPPVPPSEDAHSAGPVCAEVAVTFPFDYVVSVKVSDSPWEVTKELTVDVPVNGPDVVLTYREKDSKDLNDSGCPEQKKVFAVGDLVDARACTAKKVETLMACPKLR